MKRAKQPSGAVGPTDPSAGEPLEMKAADASQPEDETAASPPAAPSDGTPTADAGELPVDTAPFAWSGAQEDDAGRPNVDAPDAVTESAAVDTSPTGDGEPSEPPAAVDGSRLEGILESVLFAADRPLMLTDFKRLLGDRDGKRISNALENLRERHSPSGIQLVSVAGGWQLRTHPGNGAWVAKLVAARPPRLSRAMMETLSIVAYRQPITRPEIDEIRGVDCGPVLHTLLDRGLIRVIGKKEEVGRPMLYGTTPEFLKIFSLRDLTDLPTLREFHELSEDDRAKVDATASAATSSEVRETVGGVVSRPVDDAASHFRSNDLPDIDPEEGDSLIDALEQATVAATRAARLVADPTMPAESDPATAPPLADASEFGDR